jgi:hypothetical protein
MASEANQKMPFAQAIRSRHFSSIWLVIVRGFLIRFQNTL